MKYKTFEQFVIAATIMIATISVLGDEWKFAKESAATAGAEAVGFDDSAWTAVEVPHDWAISGPFVPEVGGNYGMLPWRGVGWYRREIKLSAEAIAEVKAGGAMWLEFDGVMANPQVFVNGQLAGGWDYGYMSFRVDVAPWVVVGRNLIAVKADTRYHDSRWYPGAGIYRAVRLKTAPAVHVAPGSVFVKTGNDNGSETRTVKVAMTVTNRLERAVNANAKIELGEGGAAPASAEIQLKAGEAKSVELTVTIENPKLWDVESPNLYTMKTSVSAEGKTDTVSTRFGVRTAEFRADDGFFLNGRRVQLKGVNIHADLGVLGMAFNRSAARRQLEIMRDMGVNALRTSHNPPDPAVLDLCDEMGIVVWDEGFDKWDGTSGRKPGANMEEYISRNLRELVKRDRNHPCVVVWSIGNEIAPKGYMWTVEEKGDDLSPDGMTRERCRAFRDAVRAEDTTRPVGIGCCHDFAVGFGILDDLDLTGWNYLEKYVPMKKQYPKKPVVYSESASALSSYGYYAMPPPKGKTEFATNDWEVCSYDHNAAEWSDIADHEFARMERDQYCAGEFVWTGFDYLGEPTPYAKVVIRSVKTEEESRSSYFGIVDLTGVPKDRYYLYRSQWRKDVDTTHILPHWNWEGREGKPVPVYVYTSGDEAELFLNGRSMGRRVKGQQKIEGEYYQVMNRYRLMWNEVPYEPGELKVVAYRGGQRIGEDVIRTAGKAVAVKLTPEAKTLPADGETLVFVQVDVIDAQGVRDPRATNLMRFSLTGPGRIVAVGNGDPRGMKPFTEIDSHPLYFGKAVVVLRRDKGATGEITLKVESDGLKCASADF